MTINLPCFWLSKKDSLLIRPTPTMPSARAWLALVASRKPERPKGGDVNSIAHMACPWAV
jgi:hypothetical protein